MLSQISFSAAVTFQLGSIMQLPRQIAVAYVFYQPFVCHIFTPRVNDEQAHTHWLPSKVVGVATLSIVSFASFVRLVLFRSHLSTK